MGEALLSASVTASATTFCVFSGKVMEEAEVNTGATSSTSVIVTVKVVLDVDWSALVALTVTSHVDDVS